MDGVNETLEILELEQKVEKLIARIRELESPGGDRSKRQLRLIAVQRARIYELEMRFAETAMVVHILVVGAALCGLGCPNDWPARHLWVAGAERHDATCPACIRGYRLIFSPEEK